MARVLVALTGASGAIYGVRAVQRLAMAGIATDVLLSDTATRVLGIEHGLSGDPLSWFDETPPGDVTVYGNDDLAAPPASGSQAPDAMLVIPCSMGTLARIATGVSGSLIERCADVMLKERRPLAIVPRETPLSPLHLRNMLSLAEMGAAMVPAMPAFYFRPQGVDELIEFVVDRALQAAQVDLPLRHRWRPSARSDP